MYDSPRDRENCSQFNSKVCDQRLAHFENEVGLTKRSRGGDFRVPTRQLYNDRRVERACQLAFTLRTKFTSLLSLPPTTICCDSVPKLSCHTVMVYLPGGRSGSLKEPSPSVTAK